MPQIKPTRGSQLNKAHRLSRGLVGLWLFNEGSGGQVFDLSGNGNDGTFGAGAASPIWVPGKFGSDLSFDGGDYADTLFNPTSIGTDSTVSFWVYISSITGWHVFYTVGNNHFRCQIDTDGKVYYYGKNRSDTNGWAGISAGQWYHIVIVDTAAKISLYVNGILRQESVQVVTPVDTTLDIGSAAGASGLIGYIDNFIVYGRALSASEIAQLYREPFCMFEREISPAYFFVPAGVDWIGINSSHLDSCCHAGEGGALLTGALDGTGYWYHDADETHWFIIDLGATYNIQKVRGRSEIISFDPTYVNVYVNNTGEAPWGDAVASGIDTWQDTADWVEIEVTPTSGRFVKVEIVDTEDVGGGIGFGCTSPNFAIFDVYGEAYTPPTGIPILRRRRAG